MEAPLAEMLRCRWRIENSLDLGGRIVVHIVLVCG